MRGLGWWTDNNRKKKSATESFKCKGIKTTRGIGVKRVFFFFDTIEKQKEKVKVAFLFEDVKRSPQPKKVWVFSLAG